MKHGILKIISAILLLSVLIFTAASCEKKTGPEDPKIVLNLTFGDRKYEVCADEYRYFYFNAAELTPDTAENDALEMLTQAYAIYDLAEDYDVKLTKEEEADITAYMEDFIAQKGTAEEYRKALDEAHMTEWCFRHLLEQRQTWSDVYDHVTDMANGVILTTDDELIADIQTNFYRTQTLYVSNEADEDADAKRAKAEEAAKKAADGEDFFSLIEQYSDAPQTEDGRYFTKGELVEEYENTAAALKIGEVSGVFEISGEFYIIRRLPIEEQYVLDNLETLRESYMARCFNEMLEAKEKSVKIDRIDLTSCLSEAEATAAK